MGLSNAAKGCIACGVCTAVVVAIMIPVNILVIAPSMGQHALNVATMEVPNATVYDLPDNLHFNKSAHIYNKVKLDQTSLPFPSKLHETQLVMHIPKSPEGMFFQWPPRNLAYFTMPEQDIKHGMNKFEVTADLTVMENTDDFVHWAFMLSFLGFPYGAPIYMVGQPKMSAMGIFHMDLKMGKELNCTYFNPLDPGNALMNTITPETTYEEFVTARRLAGVGGGIGPVTLICHDQGNLDDDIRDEILTNFTRQLEHPVTTPPPTTTTTAAPTPPAPAPPAPAPAPAPVPASNTTAAPSMNTTAAPAMV
jgi:hypothetical protein